MKSLVLIAVVTLISLTALAEPPPQVTTATQKYEAALKQAEQAYQRILLGLKRAYLQELQRSISIATKEGDLDTANAVNEIKKKVESEVADLQWQLAPSRVIHVRVDAHEKWQDAAVLTKGERVKITAKGTWCIGNLARSERTFGPAGWAGAPPDNTFVKGAKRGALLGQLGPSVSEVGEQAEFTAPQTAVLRLHVNDPDWGLGDNDGALDVTITIVEP